MPGRYASALFELAGEEKSIDRVAADLASFQAAIDESADLKRLVRSPVFSADDQIAAIEAICATGRESLRYGPMKPVGLRDPRTGMRPWAVVQLR